MEGLGCGRGGSPEPQCHLAPSKEEMREKSECVTPERHGTGGETEGQEGSEKRKEREGVDNRREEGTNLGANTTLL